jgi:hypothetical protein
LKTGSSYETGCFGPCLCPVISRAMQGTFRLRQTSVDPLFTNYEVLDVRWTLPDATENRTIVGSGTYRVGGEFAVQHQMVLDLTVGGGSTQRFDSGMILGGGTFPQIDIKVSLHGEQACVDTVFHVIAAPGTSTSAEESATPGVSGIRAVTPTPLHEPVNLTLTVARSSQVEVAIFDTAGRLVRHLDEGWRPAGQYPMTWDGRSDAGAISAAGLYFARATIAGEGFVARVVRVK